MHKAFVVNDEHTSLAACRNVLCFVERKAAQMTYATQCAPLIMGIDGLRSILNHQQSVSLRKVHHGIHVASHTCIVHHNDGLCSRGDKLFNVVYV